MAHMARNRILIVEDLASVAMSYAGHLERAGHESVIVDSGAAVLDALADGSRFDVILLDLQLPDVDGLQLLRDHPEILRRCPIIVATADASLSRAIDAMRLGAFDFLVKPVAGSRLTTVVASAIETGAKSAEPASSARTDQAPPQRGRPGHFIGNSPPMREIYRQIECIARSRATVFVTGESGTGKEVCAEAIHGESGRAKGPFVAINCGAIPENLLESELFGHLKGAFTGAVNDRVGAAQAAHKGTLFLDEICEMALPLQVKLLRFLQTGTVQRVGSNKVEDVDVRIVCATNRDPEREVAEGRFREDLYYRLAVVPLHLPPLRERGEDIPLLANSFLQQFAREEGKRFHPLGASQIAALNHHPWPGNVRELQNVLRRVAVLQDGPDVLLSALPSAGAGRREMPERERAAPPVDMPATPRDRQADIAAALQGLTLDEIERIAVEGAISHANGSLPAAARILGVSASTLYRKRERWLMRPGEL